MERSSGNFDRAVFERAEVVQVRKQRTKCRDFQKKTIERGFRSSWVRTSEVLLYQFKPPQKPKHCVSGPMAPANKPYVWIKSSELIPSDLSVCRPNRLQENPMIYRRTSIFSYRFGFMNIQKWFRAWVVVLFFSFLFIFLFLIPSSLLNFLP